MKFRRGIPTLAAALALASFAQCVEAQTYPDKPVTVIVPFAAGGGIDVLARVIASSLQEVSGQSFVVENVPGATGEIGAKKVSGAKPDGYVLLATNDSVATNAAMKREALTVEAKLKPVSGLYTTPLAIAVHPSVPARTFEELIQYLRDAKSDQFYSSCGVGTVQNITAELVKQIAKVKIGHISYKGCGPAMTDGLGGHVPILFNTVPNVLPQAQSGGLRILAVTVPIEATVDGKPIPVLSQIPGFENVKTGVWTGLFAPPGTPDRIVDQINELLAKAKGSAAVIKHIQKVQMTDMPYSKAEFGVFVDAEASKLLQVVVAADIKPEQ
ncbi:Bug family tripartite tricarboxylate transporter substrate binding protein [Rhizobium leguminosarum]|uniref:Bug family tripartite tricarboxylate transporter substrate binding protein n=1 Tax=Rhizobium leguminosarum TaxID=384 RepID=UPI003F956F4C